MFCADLYKNVENGKIWPLVISGLCWPDLWPDLKIDRSFSIIIVDVLSIAAYRVSLRGAGAELEGAWNTPLQHDTENTGHQHGASKPSPGKWGDAAPRRFSANSEKTVKRNAAKFDIS